MKEAEANPHDTEYLIAAYADGDLSASVRAEVEALLATSVVARQTLKEYRQLSVLLHATRETPDIHWADMRSTISAGVAEIQAGAATPLRMGEGLRLAGRDAGLSGDVGAGSKRSMLLENNSRQFWSRSRGIALRRTAMAAGFLLAVGLGWQLHRFAPAGIAPAVANSAHDNQGGSASNVAAIASGSAVASTKTDVASGPTLASSGAGNASPLNISVGSVLSFSPPIAINFGPAPAIAKEFPSIKMDPNELHPRYGTVFVAPDTQTARDDGLPY